MSATVARELLFPSGTARACCPVLATSQPLLGRPPGAARDTAEFLAVLSLESLAVRAGIECEEPAVVDQRVTGAGLGNPGAELDVADGKSQSGHPRVRLRPVTAADRRDE